MGEILMPSRFINSGIDARMGGDCLITPMIYAIRKLWKDGFSLRGRK